LQASVNRLNVGLQRDVGLRSLASDPAIPVPSDIASRPERRVKHLTGLSRVATGVGIRLAMRGGLRP